MLNRKRGWHAIEKEEEDYKRRGLFESHRTLPRPSYAALELKSL